MSWVLLPYAFKYLDFLPNRFIRFQVQTFHFCMWTFFSFKLFSAAWLCHHLETPELWNNGFISWNDIGLYWSFCAFSCMIKNFTNKCQGNLVAEKRDLKGGCSWARAKDSLCSNEDKNQKVLARRPWIWDIAARCSAELREINWLHLLLRIHLSSVKCYFEQILMLFFFPKNQQVYTQLLFQELSMILYVQNDIW